MSNMQKILTSGIKKRELENLSKSKSGGPIGTKILMMINILTCTIIPTKVGIDTRGIWGGALKNVIVPPRNRLLINDYAIGEENTGLWAERNMEGFEPPIVLIVERTKNLKGQPWYHKEILERLGLGYNTYKGKQVAVPNMSFYTSKLYQVKHSIKITPITFPDGLPSREDFDPQMAKLTIDGKFLYHPKIKEANLKIKSGNAPDRLKIKESTYKQDAHKHWNNPYDSPFGNSNYSRDTTVFRPEKKDFKSDYTVKDTH